MLGTNHSFIATEKSEPLIIRCGSKQFADDYVSNIMNHVYQSSSKYYKLYLGKSTKVRVYFNNNMINFNILQYLKQDKLLSLDL